VGLPAVGILLFAVVWVAVHTAPPNSQSAAPTYSRDFMFQVIGVHVSNQGGQSANLFFHYRYNDGIAEQDIPDYRLLRTEAVNYLAALNTTRNPYWETVNKELCARLKNHFPIKAISCELQVASTENPGPHQEPGYRASVETLGDIDALSIPGPLPVA
jgi:hypothetical protein